MRSLLLLAVLACVAWPMVAQHRGKAVARPSHTAQHAVARSYSRSFAVARKPAGRAGARSAPRGAAPRSAARKPARGHAGYGTNAQTSYRATVNPESRLDLISGLAGTLAHGASAIRYPTALGSFYAALAANAEQPAAQPASLPVRVLQFGDSHTAADMFTGEARRVFQGQFGNGSVGYSYAGHPFAGYRILGSSRSQSGGWTTRGNHFTDLGDAMTGLGGIAIQTYRAGEWVSEDAPCTSYEVQYLQQPGGGSLQVTDNGQVVGQIDTSAPAPDTSTGISTTAGVGYGAGAWRYDCPTAQGFAYLPHHFVLTTQTDAPVRLLGTVALQPGVTWEAMGINGAEAPLMLKWEQMLFTTYLGRTGASLVVLAYGTNEAAARWTYESYSEVFARLIEKIHATLPNAAVLVLGPGDRSLATSSGYGRRRRTFYAPYSGTERIVEAQRDVCRTHGCAFWDWQQRMGGLGSMQKWVSAGWAQPDHTHLTGEGYRTLADALLADLLAGYDTYRVAHGLPSQPLRGIPGAAGTTGATGTIGLPATAPTALPNGTVPQPRVP